MDLVIFLIACLSKTLATVMTYPYTVVRTFQHLGGADKPLKEIITELYNDGGFLRFFKGNNLLDAGMSPKLIQTVLNSALILVLYERLSKIFLSLIRLLKFGSGVVHAIKPS